MSRGAPFHIDDCSAEAVGARMRLARQAVSLLRGSRVSQSAWADALGVTKSQAQHWEAGRASPTLEQLARLAKQFRVSASFIIYGELDAMPHALVEALRQAATAAVSSGDPR